MISKIYVSLNNIKPILKPPLKPIFFFKPVLTTSHERYLLQYPWVIFQCIVDSRLIGIPMLNTHCIVIVLKIVNRVMFSLNVVKWRTCTIISHHLLSLSLLSLMIIFFIVFNWHRATSRKKVKHVTEGNHLVGLRQPPRWKCFTQQFKFLHHCTIHVWTWPNAITYVRHLYLQSGV